MFKEYCLWLLKIVTIIILLLFVPIFMVGFFSGIGKQLKDSNASTATAVGKRVAVVEVSGIIEDSKKILKDLYRYADDRTIDGIVLRINSPGGAVAPSQEIYSAVTKLKSKKPIVASMGTLAASGGLYVALGATKVLAQPGTLTGSIGVILQTPNFTKVANSIGVEMLTIKSGEFKDTGNPFREATERDLKFLQNVATTIHRDFQAAVSDGRGIDREQVRKFSDGRLIIGSQALQYGLIDGYGDLYDAARLIYELKGKALKEGELPNLVMPDDRFERFRKMFEGLSNLLPFSTSGLVSHPKAYFLMSSSY